MTISCSAVDQKLCLRRSCVYQVIISLAVENAHYFRCRRAAYGDRFTDQCMTILRHLRKLERDVSVVSASACQFDLDDSTPGNGYRSMVAVVDMCLLHLIRLLGRISEQRSSLLFMSGHYCRELESYTAVLGVLKSGICYAKRFMGKEPGCLFPPDEDPDMDAMMDEFELLDQRCFYGRCMGFHFCSSLIRPFQIISVGMAAFSDGFAFDPKADSSAVGLVRTAVSLLNSGKYIMNPERRAERIVHVTRNASIGFCKAFWNITETDFLRQLSSIQCPVLGLNQVLFIPFAGQPTRLSLPASGGTKIFVPLPSIHTGPRPVQIRLLSNVLREGMCGSSDTSVKAAAKSSCLLLHCHGGGFVAQSSKSHEGYLKYWAKSLDVPIVSVDYSKAPENPYPRAQDEVLYTFAWLINNPELVGWTGEKIILTGDSAGGNLVTTTTLRLISMGVSRLPDALVLTYTAFLVRYVPSPSRFLSLMDPLLPLGILARCMAAYTANTELFEDVWPEQENNAVTLTTAEKSQLMNTSRTLRRKLSSRSSTTADHHHNGFSSSLSNNSDSPSRVVKSKACRTQNIDHVESQKSSSSSSEDGSLPSDNHQRRNSETELLSYVRFKGGANVAASATDKPQKNAPASASSVPTTTTVNGRVIFEIPPIEISEDLSVVVPDDEFLSAAEQLSKPAVCSSPIPTIETTPQAFFPDSFMEGDEQCFQPDSFDELPQLPATAPLLPPRSGSVSAASVRRRTASEASCQSNQSEPAAELSSSTSLLGSFLSVARSTVRAVASYATLSPGTSMAEIEKGISLHTAGTQQLHDRSFDSVSSLERSALNEDLLAETEAQALQNMSCTPESEQPNSMVICEEDEDEEESITVQSRAKIVGGSTEALTTVQIQKDPAKICLSLNFQQPQDNDELLRYLDKHRLKNSSQHMRVCNSASADSFLPSFRKQPLKLADSIDEERYASVSSDLDEAVRKRPLAASAAVSVQSDGSTTSSNENVFGSSYMDFTVPPVVSNETAVLSSSINRRQAIKTIEQHAGVVNGKSAKLLTRTQASFELSEEVVEVVELPDELSNGVDDVGGLSDEEACKADDANAAPKRSPLHRFHSSHTGFKKDPFLSPLDATDDMLSQLPKSYLIACHLDPLLDDSIMFARRARQAKAKFVHVDLLDSLPHGFLNFTLVSADCKQASKFIVKRIREAFDSIPSTPSSGITAKAK